MDHLNAHKHVSAKPVPNVMRGCLISFLMGYDRNDRNDKGNGKSYMRKIGRGLQISCHSCHLCHWLAAILAVCLIGGNVSSNLSLQA